MNMSLCFVSKKKTLKTRQSQPAMNRLAAVKMSSSWGEREGRGGRING